MKLLLTLLLLTNIFASIKAQPGTLDKNYGNGGLVYDTVRQLFTASSAMQADNKLIVGGAIYGFYNTYRLLRYQVDGTLDTSFGNKGAADVAFTGYQGPTYGWASVQLQPDGKIVAAGYLLKPDDYPTYPPWNADIVLARFNPDGTPDASFGNKGVVITDFGEYESCNAMALQPDGKIVTTGIYSLRGTGYDTNILTVRYNADGTLDNSFGGKGYVIYTTPGTGADNGNAIAVQQDGRIVIAGDWSVNARCILIRYLPNGDLDNSFGTGGSVFTQVGRTDAQQQSFYAVAIDKEQRIIAAGLSNDDFIAVARYNTDGTPDNSFDQDGQKSITFYTDDYYDEARTVLLLKDGRILLAGDANVPSASYSALVCLQPDGSFDSSFGTNGKVTTDFGVGGFSYQALLQSDGKIVLTGGSFINIPVTYYLLARYNGYSTQQPLSVRIKRWLLHHGISWQMQPTKDVRYYAVQRSADGIVYKEIAKLSNKTQVDNYEDATITGSSYYRLAAIGWDGSRTYSNTVLIDESAQVKIFPNPVKDNLQLQGLQSGKTNLSIVDLQGNVRSSAVASGSNYSINTSGLMPGNYLLKLQHNNVTTTLPFVKE